MLRETSDLVCVPKVKRVTCSRAPEIQRGSRDPQVLRTNEFLLGLPTLSGPDKDRVMTAHAIYDGVTSFLLEAQEKNILWSVENPKNSLLWEIPFVHALFAHVHFVDVDACCYYGGERLVTKAQGIPDQLQDAPVAGAEVLCANPLD